MLIDWKSIGASFAAAPSHTTPPLFVPVTWLRIMTLSLSPMVSTVSTLRSGKACMTISWSIFAVSRPTGSPGGRLFELSNFGEKYWSSEPTSPRPHASSTSCNVFLLSSTPMAPPSSRRSRPFYSHTQDARKAAGSTTGRNRLLQCGPVSPSRRHAAAPRVAFVLGGGGHQGAYEVGMLKALLERGVVPDLVVGTSVGALNGAAIAARPSLDTVARLREIWLGLDDDRIFGGSFFAGAANLVRSRTHLHSNRPLRALLVN